MCSTIKEAYENACSKNQFRSFINRYRKYINSSETAKNNAETLQGLKFSEWFAFELKSDYQYEQEREHAIRKNNDKDFVEKWGLLQIPDVKGMIEECKKMGWC